MHLLNRVPGFVFGRRRLFSEICSALDTFSALSPNLLPLTPHVSSFEAPLPRKDGGPSTRLRHNGSLRAPGECCRSSSALSSITQFLRAFLFSNACSIASSSRVHHEVSVLHNPEALVFQQRKQWETSALNPPVHAILFGCNKSFSVIFPYFRETTTCFTSRHRYAGSDGHALRMTSTLLDAEPNCTTLGALF